MAKKVSKISFEIPANVITPETKTKRVAKKKTEVVKKPSIQEQQLWMLKKIESKIAFIAFFVLFLWIIMILIIIGMVYLYNQIIGGGAGFGLFSVLGGLPNLFLPGNQRNLTGPGGCNSRETCQQYCSSNEQECISWCQTNPILCGQLLSTFNSTG